jgi:hypothetical protein
MPGFISRVVTTHESAIKRREIRRTEIAADREEAELHGEDLERRRRRGHYTGVDAGGGGDVFAPRVPKRLNERQQEERDVKLREVAREVGLGGKKLLPRPFRLYMDWKLEHAAEQQRAQAQASRPRRTPQAEEPPTTSKKLSLNERMRLLKTETGLVGAAVVKREARKRVNARVVLKETGTLFGPETKPVPPGGVWERLYRKPVSQASPLQLYMHTHPSLQDPTQAHTARLTGSARVCRWRR